MENVASKRGTTVIAVRRNGRVALAGDGQITMGEVIVKHSAKKIRTLHQGKVLAGFAGSVADALTLFDRFEQQLEKHSGQLRRAAVELAQEWRTDRYLRRLEASLLVADATTLLTVSGDGDVIEPDNDIVAIGSGGGYALAAGLALLKHTDLDAPALATEALGIAGKICIYTNAEVTMAELGQGNDPQTQDR